jgi:hypothetical protein
MCGHNHGMQSSTTFGETFQGVQSVPQVGKSMMTLNSMASLHPVLLANLGEKK